MFPSVEQLRTPMYFTDDEFRLLEGSNLHGAIVDRQQQWQDEYEQCRGLIKDKLQDDEEAFSLYAFSYSLHRLLNMHTVKYIAWLQHIYLHEPSLHPFYPKHRHYSPTKIHILS